MPVFITTRPPPAARGLQYTHLKTNITAKTQPNERFAWTRYIVNGSRRKRMGFVRNTRRPFHTSGQNSISGGPTTGVFRKVVSTVRRRFARKSLRPFIERRLHYLELCFWYKFILPIRFRVRPLLCRDARTKYNSLFYTLSTVISERNIKVKCVYIYIYENPTEQTVQKIIL